MKQTESQASVLIELCTIAKLAKWCRLTETQIYRWKYARKKGGAGGVVPAKHQRAILAGAKADGIDLSPEFFFSHLMAAE